MTPSVFGLLVPAFSSPPRDVSTGANQALDLQSGMVIAVPIPEREAAQAEPTTKAINQALQEAQYGLVVWVPPDWL